jgi:hypothetical protein
VVDHEERADGEPDRGERAPRSQEAARRPYRIGVSIRWYESAARPTVRAVRTAAPPNVPSPLRSHQPYRRVQTLSGQCHRYIPYESRPRYAIGARARRRVAALRLVASAEISAAALAAATSAPPVA